MSPSPPPAPGTTAARTDPDAERLLYQIMLDPLGDEPYEGYRHVREQAPALLTSDGTLALSRFDDCEHALRHRALGKDDQVFDPKISDTPLNRSVTLVELFSSSMLFANPPDHTRLRRLVSSAFNTRHVQDLRPAVTGRTGTLLEALAAEPGGDFITTVALPLPVNVISDLLGIPEADRMAFTPKVHALVAALAPTADQECVLSGERAGRDLIGYFSALLTDKRAHPADDMLSRLVASREDDALDDQEMISTAILLFIAGFETTTNLLGNGLNALLNDPGQFRRLREHPELIPLAIEELLRFDPPVQFTVRTVLEPVTLAGADLEPGRMVLPLFAAANHDPERFDHPERLDLGRDQGSHLAFASGLHFCLGAHLTRLEAEVFLHFLVTRYDIERSGEAARRPIYMLRGFERLPVTLTPRPQEPTQPA
ncbi:cytochrome P450 [Actinomadura barringtoniae]|uniref:Cytochrome P450 n=1 Tax=Actinomadura barringtoniae TaxID=1427535 RepID=A0A939PGL8_9ACTN|nr:cytochrome P450 [Actinomadura barringtoniae]MBO2449718.1 cytochrome P450 [Actinomadura barringtoniae]